MNANIFRFSLITALSLCVSAVVAAPVESVSSDRASAAKQQIDAFLGQQAATQRLTAMGVTRAQVDVHLAQLSDTEVEQLAAQIDLLQAGGTIQGGNAHAWGPLGCIFRPVGRLFHDLYHLIFCWGKLTTE